MPQRVRQHDSVCANTIRPTAAGASRSGAGDVTLDADHLMRSTAVNLQAGGFAHIATTNALVRARPSGRFTQTDAPRDDE